MPYKAKGKCIYKKTTGQKVGCTKGSVKKYMAALHANVKESKKPSFQRFFDSVGGEIWTRGSPGGNIWITELSDLQANGYPFPKEVKAPGKKVNLQLFTVYRTKDVDAEITHWEYTTNKGTKFIVYND